MMAFEAGVQWIDPADFLALAEKAAASARLRTNANFHSGPADPVQRMLNVLVPGSYVPPHRHVSPPKSETMLVLQGEAGLVLFNDRGQIIGTRRLSGQGNPLGTDIAAGVWHSVVALSDPLVLFEIKPGPYDPSADKGLADWAPGEGDAGASAYLKKLEMAFA